MDVIRYCDRDVIVVKLPDGTTQPFYRSTGHNSGRPGVWFPFDGWRPGGPHGWFIKDRFIVRGPLNRYGTQEMKDESDRLATMDIPIGDDVDHGSLVNEFIQSAGPAAYV